jgi:hypothetical protein
MSQWGETAKDNPLKTAAVAAGAVAAGVFLWSKRNEISNQISELSDQIADWTNEMRNGSGSSNSRDLALTGGPNESSAIESSRATRSTGSRSRSTGSSRSASSRSGSSQANQTTGGRSQGENTTF